MRSNTIAIWFCLLAFSGLGLQGCAAEQSSANYSYQSYSGLAGLDEDSSIVVHARVEATREASLGAPDEEVSGEVISTDRTTVTEVAPIDFLKGEELAGDSLEVLQSGWWDDLEGQRLEVGDEFVFFLLKVPDGPDGYRDPIGTVGGLAGIFEVRGDRLVSQLPQQEGGFSITWDQLESIAAP